MPVTVPASAPLMVQVLAVLSADQSIRTGKTAVDRTAQGPAIEGEAVGAGAAGEIGDVAEAAADAGDRTRRPRR